MACQCKMLTGEIGCCVCKNSTIYNFSVYLKLLLKVYFLKSSLISYLPNLTVFSVLILHDKVVKNFLPLASSIISSLFSYCLILFSSLQYWIPLLTTPQVILPKFLSLTALSLYLLGEKKILPIPTVSTMTLF